MEELKRRSGAAPSAASTSAGAAASQRPDAAQRAGEADRSAPELSQPEPLPGPVDLDAAARAIEAFLRALGHDPARDPALAQTGRLVAEAFHHELLAGHRIDPAEALGETLAADGCEMVVVRGIDVACICPHHLLPARGVIHLGYVPGAKLAGLGGLARLARCFAQRLILQETLCEKIAQALMTQLDAAAAGCIAELSPACLTCRGERPAGADVACSAWAGSLRTDPTLRAEFLALAMGSRPRTDV